MKLKCFVAMCAVVNQCDIGCAVSVATRAGERRYAEQRRPRATIVDVRVASPFITVVTQTLNARNLQTRPRMTARIDVETVRVASSVAIVEIQRQTTHSRQLCRPTALQYAQLFRQTHLCRIE
jgi:hypothetical protein